MKKQNIECYFIIFFFWLIGASSVLKYVWKVQKKCNPDIVRFGVSLLRMLRSDFVFQYWMKLSSCQQCQITLGNMRKKAKQLSAVCASVTKGGSTIGYSYNTTNFLQHSLKHHGNERPHFSSWRVPKRKGHHNNQHCWKHLKICLSRSQNEKGTGSWCCLCISSFREIAYLNYSLSMIKND